MQGTPVTLQQLRMYHTPITAQTNAELREAFERLSDTAPQDPMLTVANRPLKAIAVSVLLQTSYHFYQGVPEALGHGAGFLLFSFYYARTNRIGPVILAHLCGDVIPYLQYMSFKGS